MKENEEEREREKQEVERLNQTSKYIKKERKYEWKK